MVKVTVIIPTFNHLEDCLKPCCTSLIKNTKFITDKLNMNVCVVANGCTDGTETYIKSLPNFTCISFPQALGYPKAINEGIKANFDSDYFVLMNNDIQILDWGCNNHWIDTMFEPFEKYSDCGITGSLPKYSEEIQSEFMIFCDVMISKKLINKIGLLDEIFTPGGCEDIDYCMKAKLTGFKSYVVPLNSKGYWENDLHISRHPSYHAAEKTVFGLSNWLNIFDRNCKIVKDRYADFNRTRTLSNNKISIIIPTHNHLEDCLKPCCESIIKHTNFTDDIEVIVVANGCTDNTKNYVLSLSKNFKLLNYTEKLGYTKAVNYGLKHANGDYILLLNNDIVLLDWAANNTWLNLLLDPFDKVENCGITGPIKGYSEAADADFIVFFCAMISRRLYNDLGLLDETFSPGGGEDTDYSIKAERKGYKLIQVPYTENTVHDGQQVTGTYPIYHIGEKTVFELPNWNEIFDRNTAIICERYNTRWKLSNNCERAVIGKDNPVPPRETARYEWAVKNVIGTKVLEIGCSSGYGLKFLKKIDNLDYLGIDYDASIVDYAKQNFGDIPGVKFQQADINKFEFGQYDTIIAFEVLEHIDNGKEIAQKLKNHCKRLLISAPYKEVPGLWGPHHKLHNLTEQDFPGFQYFCIDEDGSFKESLLDKRGLSLLLMMWSNPEINKSISVKKIDVTCVVSTKGRHNTTLPHTLLAICNQTYKPKELIVFDDNEQFKDPRVDPLYSHIFSLLSFYGITWFYEPGQRIGQVANHIRSLQLAKSEWIWRLDDDNVPEPDVLEKLVKNIASNVGAVGGLVIQSNNIRQVPSIASNKIEDIYLGLNEQWFLHSNNSKLKEVDHLYSSFLYRKSIASYNTNLSVVGHREETLLTYQMKLKGYANLLDPSAKTWHLCNPTGGIRSDNIDRATTFGRDEGVFQQLLAEHNIKTNNYSFVVLDNGIGDHYVFRYMLPKYFEKYKDKKHVFFVCYEQVFSDVQNITMASIADAHTLFGSIDKYNIYKFMIDHNWRLSLNEAFEKLYDIQSEKQSINIQQAKGKSIIISPYSHDENHAKSYPYWNDLVFKLKELGLKIKQIGKKGELKINNVDEYLWDLSFKSIEEEISNCRTWIGVDNFLQHLVNCMNPVIKGVVIFGASDPIIFGYSYNKNLYIKKYLRLDQFNTWQGINRNNEAFRSAIDVFNVIKQICLDPL